MSANTASHSVTRPSGARVRKIALTTTENRMFCQMMREVRRARRSVCGSAAEVVAHQRDVGGLEGRVGAGRAHGDAKVGGWPAPARR